MSKKYRGSKQTEKDEVMRGKVSGVNKPYSISVIVPAYNLEDVIERCLDSIIRQDAKDMEIIVVDDCSKDKTRNIIMKYQEKFPELVKCILHDTNTGVSVARNEALNLASKEYIHFCDGDDEVPAGAYKEMLSIAYKKDADIVVGNYSRRYPNDGNSVRQFSYYHAADAYDRCFESGNTTLWNKIYKREFIEKYQLRFNPKLKFYEDYLFYNSFLLKSPKAAYTDTTVYVYTEPYQQDSDDRFDGKIRYANVECAEGLYIAWKQLLSDKEINERVDLWQDAFFHNLGWYFNCSWLQIQNIEVKEKTFELLKELLVWVQENVKCIDMTDAFRERFVSVFKIEYATLIQCTVKEYLMYLAITNDSLPRKAESHFTSKWNSYNADRDNMIYDATLALLDEIKVTFSLKYKNLYLWKSNYWNVLDSLMNDYWRELTDRNLKEKSYNEIKKTLKELMSTSSLCKLSSPEDVQRFQQIFGVDYISLNEFNYSEYMLASNTTFSVRYVPMAVEKTAETAMIHPVEINACAIYENACINGQIGMKGILRGIKGYFKFKLRRK